MVTDTGIIVTSIIGLMGMVLMFMINNGNWFRRENFKLQKSNILAENRLKMKKLEKELGLKNVSNPIKSDDTPGVLDLLKGLDTDKISGILNMLQNNEDDIPEEREGGIMDLIDKIPPEAIQGLLDGLNKNKKEEGINTLYQS